MDKKYQIRGLSSTIDESTDIRDMAQLSVFIRGCDANFTVSEELLEVIPIVYRMTCADILV